MALKSGTSTEVSLAMFMSRIESSKTWPGSEGASGLRRGAPGAHSAPFPVQRVEGQGARTVQTAERDNAGGRRHGAGDTGDSDAGDRRRRGRVMQGTGCRVGIPVWGEELESVREGG